ncbi:MAG: Ig-like domain-containing protein [Micrococcaceae bacterium]
MAGRPGGARFRAVARSIGRTAKTLSAQAGRLLRRRVGIAVTLVVALIVGTLAVLHPGVPETRMDLNEGGVWVTNTEQGLVGHLNYPSQMLDSALSVSSSNFDIQQHERDILYTDDSSGAMATVDVAMAALTSATTADTDLQIVQGGDQALMVDAETGRVWASDVATATRTSLTEDTALEPVLPDAQAVVSTDGVGYAVSPRTGEIAAIQREGAGYAVDVNDAGELSSSISLTTVGDQLVIADHGTGMLRLPDGTEVLLPAEDAVLQQPGPESETVVLADAWRMYRVDLRTGDVEELGVEGQSSGTPAQPAVLGGCAYGAWSGSGAFQRWCGDEDRTVQSTVDTLAAAETPVFRVNRDVIVLNDTGDGSVWLPDEDMVLVAEWDEIDSELDVETEEEDSPQLSQEVAEPDREGDNQPPVAEPDEFGVRPGQSTQLPVLMNDSDPDGDLLTASVIDGPEAISPVRGGAALQYDAPEDASGSSSFTYQAADGRGGTDTAEVQINVHGWDVNEAPEQRRVPTVVVETGASTEYNVFPDWVDPDGDLFYLEDVQAPEGVQVQFRQEGTLRINDLGSDPGVKRITVVLSDGEKSAEGVVNLDVRPVGNIAPVANGDHVVARQGESVSIAPLDNDTDANGDQLRLAAVEPAPPGTDVTANLDTGTVDFVASSTGPYYLGYTVSDGPDTATGVIRVDVIGRDEDSEPVAQDDLALLPEGGQTLAAVLNNDSDPGGGVLVVQSIRVPEGSPLQVTLEDHHLLRIRAPQGLEEPTRLSYTVSNGTNEATADVLVVPVPQEDASAPPQPEEDRLRVRAGDVGAVPVLANDRSVNGLPLQLDEHLEHDIPETAGFAFVSGETVRFRAGHEPGLYRLTYTVRDEAGNFASSTVTIEVTEPDDGTNSAPRPQDVVAWSVAGQQARIPVALDGSDPDGDSVSLVGIQEPPSMGLVEIGNQSLNYTPASGASGTDTFTFIVEDRLGKQSLGRARVGVAQPSESNQPPNAVNDTVMIRPGRTVSVDVLANDSDPDGDALALVEDGLTVSERHAEAVSVRNDLVVVSAPETNDSITVGYRVTDNRGGTSQGTLTVNVDEDAPLRAPRAQDDMVTQEDIAEVDRVSVPVVENDVDPDGDRDDLEVFVVDTADTAGSGDDAGTSDVVVDGQQLIIPVTEQRRLVVYGVRDQDGLEGYAVVTVPGSDVERPQLVPGAVQLRAGEQRTVELDDHVSVRDGRSPRLVDAHNVRTTPGLSAAEADDGGTELLITADEDFQGSTGITFDVIDGEVGAEEGSADRGSLRSRLTLPVEVLAEQNSPPEFRASPVTVAAAEDPVQVNVCQMVTDPDGTDPETFDYRLGAVPENITASLSGCAMSVGLDSPQANGPAGSIEISVDDGHGAVDGAIPVHVASSNRPLIQVSDALIPRGMPGQTETVQIEDYTINPFPGEALRVVGSPQVTAGSGTVDVQGGAIAVTPSPSFLGTMTVSYVLEDATADPDRQVIGTIRLTVRDKPDPPTSVSAEAIGPGTALVRFEAGANNGAPITGFQVRTRDGAVTECAQTECTVDGLTNGERHSFQVTAENEMGASEPSGWSSEILVDVQPEQPPAPRLEPADRAVEVTLSPGVSQGSPITHYEVTLQPGGLTQTVQAGEQMTTRFTGLTNGQSYQATVQAFNSAERPSVSSESSAEAIPFGRPAPVSNVSLAQGSAARDSATVQVGWDYADGNGRPVQGAQIRLSDGQSRTVEHPQDSVEFTVALGTAVTAEVVQTTEHGPSETRTSGSVRPLGSPAAPSSPTVETTDVDEVTVTGVEARGGGGFRSSEIRLQVRNASGDWVKYSPGMTLKGFAVGERATVRARAVGAAEGTEAISETSEATSAERVYSTPGTLAVNSSERSDNQIVLRADRAGSERGRSIARIESDVRHGEVEQDGGADSSKFIARARPGERIEVRLRACDVDDNCSSWTTYEERVPPELLLGLADCRRGDDGYDDENCRRITISYQNVERAGDRMTCTYRPDWMPWELPDDSDEDGSGGSDDADDAEPDDGPTGDPDPQSTRLRMDGDGVAEETPGWLTDETDRDRFRNWALNGSSPRIYCD